MQKRFESDPLFQATRCCSRSGFPRPRRYIGTAAEHSDIRTTSGGSETPVRVFSSPDTPIPEVQLLSNGRYHVMVTNAGGGYSRWKDMAVTRWREDSTCDNWGTFCYLRDAIERGVLVNRLSADAQGVRRNTKRFFRRRERSSVAVPMKSTPIRKSLSRPRTTSRCAESRSPTAPGRVEPSTLRVTRKSFSPRLQRTPCIRRSAISLFRQRSSARSGRFSALAGPAPWTSPRPGCFT
jgi:hypothetical protein